jgi:regulator of sirC expression with transglutaminase-like and TPR domain
VDPRSRLTALLAAHDADTDLDIPLDVAAACLAAEEQPGVSPDDVLRSLDALAAGVRLPAGLPLPDAIARINHHLFAELGFAGDRQTYDEPANSFLDQVIQRRRGLPILLSLLYIEVARRLGLAFVGIGFPSHFLIRPREGDFFLDPFSGGRILRRGQLQVWLSRLYPQAIIDEAMLSRAVAPVTARQLLLRVNYNLKASYLRREDLDGAIRASERILLLDEERSAERLQLGQLLLSAGRREEGLGELAHFLALNPTSPDAWWIVRELGGRA